MVFRIFYFLFLLAYYTFESQFKYNTMNYFSKLLGSTLFFFVLICDEAAAQPQTITMNLQECIDYAHKNNISLKRSKLQFDLSEVDVKSAKAAFLPNLTASVSQNYSNKPFGGESETSVNNYGGNYGVGSSLTLFNGGENKNNLKLSEVNVDMSELDIALNESTIAISIARYYIEILYATDALEVNKYMLNVSRKNRERGEVLHSVEDINSADLAQLETQEANDKYNVVVAESALRNLNLQLKQLLEIDNETTVVVEIPEISDDRINMEIPSISSVYSVALEIRPEIKLNELDLVASNISLSQSKAGYLPSVNLVANMGSGHNTSSNFNFGGQMQNSWNNGLGVNVSIPIFNNRKTKSSVEKSTLNIADSELSLKDSKNNLYRTIELLHNDAINAQMKYVAAEQKLSSVNKSLGLVIQQFELGMKNTMELLIEQSNYVSTQQELLQSKYIALLNIILLNHYKGDLIQI